MSAITEGFDNKKFSVELKEIEGLFYIICKTFHIVESDTSIDRAYLRMLERRQLVLRQLSALGVNISQQINNSRTKRQLFTFSIQKIAHISIIFFCLGLPLGVFTGMIMVSNKSVSISNSVKHKIKSQVDQLLNNPSQLSSFLNTFASKLENVTPQRKEELKLATRKIVNFSRPFVEEFKVLFAD